MLAISEAEKIREKVGGGTSSAFYARSDGYLAENLLRLALSLTF